MNSLLRGYREVNSRAVQMYLLRSLARRSTKETGLTTREEQLPAQQWTEVIDKKTGGVYYWNQKTGETTALGEPKPGPGGRQIQQSRDPISQPTGSSLARMVAMGAGMVIAISAIRAIF